MNNSNTLLPTILLVLYVGAIIIGWFFVSRTLKKYNRYIIEMKKDGSYTGWAKENKALLFFARLFRYAAILCLVSFIFLSIATISKNITILFELTIPFLLSSIALYLILYLKLPKNQTEI